MPQSLTIEDEPQAVAAPPGTDLIHRLFEAQAARTPDAVAVIADDESLSYGELDRRAMRLARRLRRLGVGPDAVVAVCAHRFPALVVGLLAVLKAGGAYLPLDPDYPAERLAFMLGDAQACLLLTQTALVPALPPSDIVTLCLDDEDEWGEDGGEALPDDATPDNLAYVIYTSGSTGTPKGVEIAHESVCNNLRWRQDTFPLTAQDRLLQTYSFSFDPSVWAFFWPLTTGAAVVLPRPAESADPSCLVGLVQWHRITVLGFSPSMLSVLLGHPGIERCRSLRHVFSGGEPLTPDLQDRFFAALPSANLHNVYGPTEATIDAAWWTCRPGEDRPTIPIGHPLPRTQIRILDPDGCPVADGDSGELHIAGPGLARGYRRRPELTAARFIPNPSDARGLPTLYRTGDLGRRNPDGAIEYLGRLDTQVKVRGFRIELGEIETALSRQPQVRDAVVTAREDAHGGKTLVAYVVPIDAPPSRPALKAHLAAGLPAHMVPGAFVFLDALPLSPSGKLDRNALPAPGASDGERDGNAVPPETPLQRQLVAVFEELLGVRPLGIRDDFFEWGGHSLLAARLVTEIEKATGRRLALPDLAAGATAERLAALLEQPSPDAPALPLLQRWSDGPGRPLFFLHGSFTGGLYCGALARHLGPERPLYALAPHGSDGGRPIPPTVEAMAADYVATIRAAQPEGPYSLGGFCNGGLAAYEVARQLRQAGASVDSLVLIEVILAPTLAKLRLHHLACRLGRGLALPASAQNRLSSALQTAGIPLLRLLRAGKRLWRRLAPRLGRDPGYDWAANVPPAYQDTAVFYNLHPYPGPIAVVSARESSEQAHPRSRADWQALAPQAVFGEIAGSHFSSVTDDLSELADWLRAH